MYIFSITYVAANALFCGAALHSVHFYILMSSFVWFRQDHHEAFYELVSLDEV